jgi:hypothetical protein
MVLLRVGELGWPLHTFIYRYVYSSRHVTITMEMGGKDGMGDLMSAFIAVEAKRYMIPQLLFEREDGVSIDFTTSYDLDSR